MNRLIFDIETDHRRPDQVTRCWCICTLNPDTGDEQRFGPPSVLDGICALARAEQLIGHNIGAYDLPVLARLFGFQYAGEVIDTLTLSRLVFNGLSDEPDRHGRHALEAWGKRLGCHKGEYTDFNHWRPEMIDYCMQDCCVVQKLIERFRQEKPSKRAVKIELQYDRLLRRIEQHGLTLDVQDTERLQAKLKRRLERLQGYIDQQFPPRTIETSRPAYYSLQLHESAISERALDVPQFETKRALDTWRKQHGLKPRNFEIIRGPPQQRIEQFNANSPQQVIKGMRSLGWCPENANGSGSISTSESVLWNSGLPAGRLIAAYRGYSKLYSFTVQWLSHQREGKLYPHFVSNHAATNRSSCRAPNIQQIPSAKQRRSGMRLLARYGRLCRKLFKPQAGYVLVGADLKGIEVRLLAHRLAMHDDGAFAQLVTSGEDIHQRNADAIGITRERAKTVLYGSMYGQGASSLAATLSIDKSEAQGIISAFTTGLGGFDEMKRELLDELRRTGRITLIDGRRLQVGSQHKALNYAIQGDAAVLMKHWALKADRCLNDTSFRLLAVVHDELQSECLPDDADHVIETLELAASDVGERLDFRVRIAAEAKQGASWQETH